MLVGLGILGAGCARPRPPARAAPEPEDDGPFTCGGTGRDDVYTSTLETSYRTLDEACRALSAAAAKTRGWHETPCSWAPISLPEAAPYTAAIVRIDRSERGPLLDSSRHVLAIELDQHFYLVSTLDVLSASAGRMHPIAVSAVDASVVVNAAGRRRLLVRLRATLLPASCDSCVGEAKREVERRDLAFVCATGSQERLMCTAPIEAEVGAHVVLDEEDRLSIAGPTEAVVHPVWFRP
jgi:hypothetical protein